MIKESKKLNKDEFHDKDWASFSMTPHTEKEIRDRIINKGIDSVCVSYICRFSKLSEEFIDEMKIITTDFYRLPIIYREENYKELKRVIELRDNSGINAEAHLKIRKSLNGGWVESEIIKTGEEIKDRIDWGYISQYQILSEKFIDKHADTLDWDLLCKYQILSKELIEKNKFRLSYANKQVLNA